MNNRPATTALPIVQMKLTDIMIDADLRYRYINVAHTRDLLNALRRSDSLAAVLVWVDDRTDSPTFGKPLLVDGGHRLAAYFNGKRKNIPCRIMTGTYTEAALKALAVNARDTLPLTQQERPDGAWRLVRLHGLELTAIAIARAAGVVKRTVNTMRSRWRHMLAADLRASGEWWRDRKDQEADGSWSGNDEDRHAAAAGLAEALQKAAGMTPKRDVELFADALQIAFGRFLNDAVDHLFPREPFGEGDHDCREAVDIDLGLEPPF